MAIHSHVKIWVHFIWGTHKHERIITKELGKKLFDHIVQKSNEEKIHIEKLRIRPEHVHLLFELPSTISMEKVARLFKGESSHWIHKNNLTPFNFKWQRGYGAFSVSATQLEKVKNYIANQDEHHKRKTFAEEYDEWCMKYGMFED
ncbi:MAG: IS200/IS605 family transposase [Chlorobi bacterium]|nr:IS200/IS605 family transposase [Chlorobiota bacterium]